MLVALIHAGDVCDMPRVRWRVSDTGRAGSGAAAIVVCSILLGVSVTGGLTATGWAGAGSRLGVTTPGPSDSVGAYLTSEPTTRPGYSNGNLAYLNRTATPAQATSDLPSGSPLIVSGCGEVVPQIDSFSDSPSSGEAPLRVSFHSETWCGAEAVWGFGDGSGVTQVDPNGSRPDGSFTFYYWNYTHTYGSAGTFTANLSIESGSGENTDSTTIDVSSPPVTGLLFAVTPQLGNPPLSVGFSFETEGADGFSAHWDFGDGNGTTQATPNGTAPRGGDTYQWWNFTHKYTYVGQFTASVNVSKGSEFAPASAGIVVAWGSEVAYQATPTFGDPPLDVSFSLETRFTAGYAASWTFGDGNASTQSSPNGSLPQGSVTYQWWNYTHSYHYVGSFVPEVEVSKTSHPVTVSTNVYASFTPSLFYSFYNETGLLRQGLNGSAYSIGLVEGCGPSGSTTLYQDNVNDFDAQFDLPVLSVQYYQLPGCPNAGSGWNQNETNLDIQWAHVAAPGASIYVCLAPSIVASSLEDCITAFYQSRTANVWNTMIVSNSWGFCAQEAPGDSTPCTNATDPYQNIWNESEAAGMNLLASTGDGMWSPCDTGNYDSANPFGLAVGGTSVMSVGPSGSYGSEAIWSTTSIGGTCTGADHRVVQFHVGEMSGTSAYYAAPSWQNSTIYNTTARHFPDVSMVANLAFGVPFVGGTGKWGIAGGTSIGSPVWAGVLDMLFQAGAPNLSGFAAPFLYSHAARGCFHTISGEGGYPDSLGTPDIDCLAKA